MAKRRDNYRTMGPAIQVLLDYRGRTNRARVLRILNERPRSDYQLANALDFDYKTLCAHLSVLLDENLVQKSDEQHVVIYLLTDHIRHHSEMEDKPIFDPGKLEFARQ